MAQELYSRDGKMYAFCWAEGSQQYDGHDIDVIH